MGSEESAFAEKGITQQIIGAAIDVHRELGPGLLESAYETCLVHELRERGLKAERQIELPVQYKGIALECSYRIDVLVEDAVIVELKHVEGLKPIHECQVLTYLRLAKKRVGLLINFNVPLLRDGVKRFAL